MLYVTQSTHVLVLERTCPYSHACSTFQLSSDVCFICFGTNAFHLNSLKRPLKHFQLHCENHQLPIASFKFLTVKNCQSQLTFPATRSWQTQKARSNLEKNFVMDNYRYILKLLEFCIALFFWWRVSDHEKMGKLNPTWKNKSFNSTLKSWSSLTFQF